MSNDKKYDYDAVHTHTSKSDLIGLAAGFLTKVPVITTLHRFSRENDFKIMFYENIDKFAINFSDKSFFGMLRTFISVLLV